MKKRFKKFNLGINGSQSLRLVLLPVSLMMLLMFSFVSCGKDDEPESPWAQTSASIELMNSLADEGGCWQLIYVQGEENGEWGEYSLIDNGEYEYYWLTKEKVADRYDNGRTNYLVYMEYQYDDKTRFVKTYFNIVTKQKLYINGFNGCIGDITTHTDDEMIIETDLEKDGVELRYFLRKVDRRRPSGVEWEDWNDPARYDSPAL